MSSVSCEVIRISANSARLHSVIDGCAAHQHKVAHDGQPETQLQGCCRAGAIAGCTTHRRTLRLCK